MNDDEKVCPRCAETIKKAAIVCRYCSHDFSQVEVKSALGSTSTGTKSTIPPIDSVSTENKNRNNLIGCIGLVLTLGLIGQCVGTTGDGNLASSAPPGNTLEGATFNASTEPTPDTPKSNWDVSSYRDEVRGQMVHNSSIVSENEVEFDFPYSGGSSLTMTVRKHPKYGEDVIFQISDGQFICGIYDCKGAISFDGKAEALSLGPPEDHDSKTLFSKYPGGIISKLKKSKTVIVELTFYQEGNRQFTFKTEGLVWPPKA